MAFHKSKASLWCCYWNLPLCSYAGEIFILLAKIHQPGSQCPFMTGQEGTFSNLLPWCLRSSLSQVDHFTLQLRLGLPSRRTNSVLLWFLKDFHSTWSKRKTELKKKKTCIKFDWDKHEHLQCAVEHPCLWKVLPYSSLQDSLHGRKGHFLWMLLAKVSSSLELV